MIFVSGKNLFNEHKDSNAIKNILGLLILSVVQADSKHTLKEHDTVLRFYKNEFDMEEEAVSKCCDLSMHKDEEFQKALVELDEILDGNVVLKAKTLKMLNDVIICDGIVQAEYDVFDLIKEKLT